MGHPEIFNSTSQFFHITIFPLTQDENNTTHLPRVNLSSLRIAVWEKYQTDPTS